MTAPLSSHEEFQQEIPAYAAGRLTEEVRAHVAAHLSSCDTCRDLAATFRGLGETIGASSEALFGDHPPAAALRDAALRGEAAADPEIQRHVELCVSCALEMQAWQRMPRPAQARPPQGRVGAAWGRLGLATAAGMVMGLGLGTLVARPPAAPVIGPQLVLQPVQRSEADQETYIMFPGQQAFVVACQVTVPRDAADSDRFRFEIGPVGGPAVWSDEVTAAEMRAHLSKSEVVTLLVPAAVLSPGRHELRLLDAGRPQPPIYRKVVQVQPG
jgi:hypothetical protein